MAIVQGNVLGHGGSVTVKTLANQWSLAKSDGTLPDSIIVGAFTSCKCFVPYGNYIAGNTLTAWGINSSGEKTNLGTFADDTEKTVDVTNYVKLQFTVNATTRCVCVILS